MMPSNWLVAIPTLTRLWLSWNHFVAIVISLHSGCSCCAMSVIYFLVFPLWHSTHAESAHALWAAVKWDEWKINYVDCLYISIAMSLCVIHCAHGAASSALVALTEQRLANLKKRMTYILQHKDDTHETIFEIASANKSITTYHKVIHTVWIIFRVYL